MLNILNFEAFIIAITILTLTPGLDTALVLRNTSRAGFSDGAVTSFGICLGLFVHATLSALGVSFILTNQRSYFTSQSGWAAYLIWLGIGSLRAATTPQGIRVDVGTKQDLSVLRSLREGFLSNVLNPKTAVFY